MTQRDTTRALTRAERERFLAVAGSHEATAHLDVADIAAFMAGTGVCISEALGQRWRDIDLGAGTALIRGTKTATSMRLLDEAGLPWATPHSLRRTVASLLDEAGLPIVLAADYLGHADPGMTARVYLGRRGTTHAAAAVL